MQYHFTVDQAKVAPSTQAYLTGLFFGLFYNRRFVNCCGTVAVNCEGYQLFDYLVLYEKGVYQVYVY